MSELKNPIYIALAIIVMGAMLGIVAALRRQRKPVIKSTYTMAHVDKDGTCPKGSSLVVGMFKQKDGSRKNGCYREGKTDYTIDALYPGESVGMEVPLTIPVDEGTPKRQNGEYQ